MVSTFTSSVSAFHPVVVAPTYNNAGALAGVLGRALATGLPLIIVNDGSTDSTADILRAFAASAGDASVYVVEHVRNAGKAAALRTGFTLAGRLGFSHAVTIDTDGQLNPDEIPLLLAPARRCPDALVIGSRRRDGSATDRFPVANRVGWFMSALGTYLETGLRILDSQCGLRVYPLRLIESVPIRAARFGFEAEAITRAAWVGCPVIEVPVTCHYFEPQRRVSHFRTWLDAPHSFLLHAALTLRRLLPWPHPQATDRRHHEDVEDAAALSREVVVTTNARPTGWLRWLIWALSPRETRRQIRRDHFQQLVVAASVGIGTFMASMPLSLFNFVLATLAARRLHVQLLPVWIGCSLCLPPVGEHVERLGIAIGYACTRLTWPAGLPAGLGQWDHWALLVQVPVTWLVGGVITGFLANWITIGALVAVFRLVPLAGSSTPVE